MVVYSRILFIAVKGNETSFRSDNYLISVQKHYFLHPLGHDAVAAAAPTSNSDRRPDCFDNGSPCAYDQVGKYLESQAKFTIIHKPSDAIPSHRRIPPSLAFNGTYIKTRRTEGPADGSLTSLT